MTDALGAIESAKKNLKLREILIKSLIINVSDELGEAQGETDAGIIFRSGCAGHKILSKSEGNLDVVRFQYRCGVLLARKEVVKNTKPRDLKSEDILLEISAVYTVDYQLAELVDDETLRYFGKINVGYHVWPFWRELIQSSCGRIGITPISLPFYKPQKVKDLDEPLVE